jgi:hypothetical protein
VSIAFLSADQFLTAGMRLSSSVQIVISRYGGRLFKRKLRLLWPLLLEVRPSHGVNQHAAIYNSVRLPITGTTTSNQHIGAHTVLHSPAPY